LGKLEQFYLKGLCHGKPWKFLDLMVSARICSASRFKVILNSVKKEAYEDGRAVRFICLETRRRSVDLGFGILS